MGNLSDCCCRKRKGGEAQSKEKASNEAINTNEETKEIPGSLSELKNTDAKNIVLTRRIETGIFSRIPPELFPHVHKYFFLLRYLLCADCVLSPCYADLDSRLLKYLKMVFDACRTLFHVHWSVGVQATLHLMNIYGVTCKYI